MTGSGRDRRRFSRLPIDARVRVIAGPSKFDQTFGRAHDLGEGGMALYVPLDLKLGQQIKLEFDLPNSRTKLTVVSLVRNAEGHRYGIEFMGVTATEMEALRRALQMLELTSKEKPPSR